MKKKIIVAILASALLIGCGNDNVRDLTASSNEKDSESQTREETPGTADTTDESESSDETDTTEVADTTEATETSEAEDSTGTTDGNNESEELAITYEMCMAQYKTVIFSFATGQIPISECASEALYYGETAYGTFESGAFAFFDVDMDGNEELLLSYSDLSENGTIGFSNVYKAREDGEAQFLYRIDGITSDGHIVGPASDSSIYIDFEIGHYENGEYVIDEAYSELDDETEVTRRNGNGRVENITAAEFNEAYSKYYNNLRAIYGYELSLKNYEEVFNCEMGEVSEVVVKTTDGGVNMRSGPGTEYDVIYSMIPDGAHFWVYAFTSSTTNKPWGKVRFGGQEGWISMTQVEYLD